MSLERIASALERMAGIPTGPETAHANVEPQTGPVGDIADMLRERGYRHGRLDLLDKLGCETEEEAQKAIRAWRYIQVCRDARPDIHHPAADARRDLIHAIRQAAEGTP